MEESGMLSLINLTKEENDLFLEFLRKSNKSPAYDFVYKLLGEDWLEFMDILSGTTFKVPNQRTLFRYAEYIKIYCYISKHGFSLEAVKNATRIYNKKMVFVKSAINRVSEVLEGEIRKIQGLESAPVFEEDVCSDTDLECEELIDEQSVGEDEEGDSLDIPDIYHFRDKFKNDYEDRSDLDE